MNQIIENGDLDTEKSPEFQEAELAGMPRDTLNELKTLSSKHINKLNKLKNLMDSLPLSRNTDNDINPLLLDILAMYDFKFIAGIIKDHGDNKKRFHTLYAFLENLCPPEESEDVGVPLIHCSEKTTLSWIKDGSRRLIRWLIT